MDYTTIPTREKRSKKSNDTKNKIYICARNLFRQYGYENVSVRMITEAAGVSIGSFYHFYSSKSDLLSAMSNRLNEMFALPENLDYSTADCKKTLLTFYEEFCRRISLFTQEQLYEIVYSKGGNKTLLLRNRTYRSFMVEMLSGFKKAGQLKKDCSVEEMEDLIMTCFYGTVAHWVLCDTSYPLYAKLCSVLGCIVDRYLA